MTIKIHKPAAWENESLDDLMGFDAGQAYVLIQFETKQTMVEPEHVFRREGNGDSAAYEVYADCSLWFINNAQDEVWADYRDFVSDMLIPGIEAGNYDWTEEEAEENGSQVLNRMDRELLLHYCDGDEEEARKLVGMTK